MKATVTGALTGNDAHSGATMVTDLAVTGRVAQFGRNIMAEVAGKLVTQFANDLERHVLAPPSAAEGAASTASGATSDTALLRPHLPATQQRPAASEPLDLLAAAGGSVAKRVLPLAVGVALIFAGYFAVRGMLR